MTTETLALEAVTECIQPSDPEPELLVRIPRDAISVLGVSLDIHLLHAIQALTTTQLRSRLSNLHALPQGE